MTPFIAKIETFANEKGNKIEHFLIVQGEAPPGYAQFRGFAQLSMKDPRGNIATQDFSFPIEAAFIEDAFDKYEACSQAAGAEVMEKISLQKHKKSLILPG